MALWCWLNVNDQRIGLLDIQRHESLDLTDREAVADVVSTYTVRIDGVERATVRHRYGERGVGASPHRAGCRRPGPGGGDG